MLSNKSNNLTCSFPFGSIRVYLCEKQENKFFQKVITKKITQLLVSNTGYANNFFCNLNTIVF
jgi:hypothetical protein